MKYIDRLLNEEYAIFFRDSNEVNELLDMLSERGLVFRPTAIDVVKDFAVAGRRRVYFVKHDHDNQFAIVVEFRHIESMPTLTINDLRDE